jgi:uncharacterized protein YeaO (DUF488 family)
MHRFARQSSALCATTTLILAIGSLAYAETGANAPGAKESEANTDGTAAQPVPTKKGGAAKARRQRRPGPRPGRGFPPGLAEMRLVKQSSAEIGVSQEIVTKLDAMEKEFREEESRFKEEMGKATAKVAELLNVGRLDEKAVLQAATDASEVGRKTRLHKIRLSLDLRALLTDEQLVKFMELRTKAMQSRKQGRAQLGK